MALYRYGRKTIVTNPFLMVELASETY